jgi:hypothetical protein
MGRQAEGVRSSGVLRVPSADLGGHGRLRRRDGANLTPMRPCLLDRRLLEVELP